MENEKTLKETLDEEAVVIERSESEEVEAEGSEEVEEIEEAEGTEEDEENDKDRDIHICSLCHKVFREKSPALLTVGGYGTPRYLCDDCDDLFFTAMKSIDPEEINAAIGEIGETMTDVNCDDDLVIETVNRLIAEAVERRKKIEAGTYDFAEDEESTEEGDEIPEELTETEEDREQDRIEAERDRKLDNIWGWITVGILAAAVVAFILFRFIL